MGKEIWDAYLSNGEKAGIDLVRGELIPEGLYHLVVDVAIRHVDGDFLLMKRSQNKATDPGLYELSAGGSALKGESPFDAAKRELFEETGIVLDNFEVVNSFVHEKHKAIYYEFAQEDRPEGNRRPEGDGRGNPDQYGHRQGAHHRRTL